MRDWVMVCSSTLRARPVTQTTKERKPPAVKAGARGASRACQSDQSRVACTGHLLGLVRDVGYAPVRLAPGGVYFKKSWSLGSTPFVNRLNNLLGQESKSVISLGNYCLAARR